MEDAVSISVLEDFGAAWNRHDPDAILLMMMEDCVFEASRDPDVKGTIFTGQADVRRGIEAFVTFPDARRNDPKHFIAGDRGVSEWVFTATGPDRAHVEVQGCDILTFRNGKIAVKNSYRK